MQLRPAAVFLLSILAVAVGCGRPTTTISGRITYEGKPVKKGVISFLPADGQGPSCGCAVADGWYKAQLTPGKKNVRIVEMKVYDHIPTREEVAQEAAKRARVGGYADAGELFPLNAVGNNVEIEVKSGSQTFDFPLKRPLQPRRK